ncbi:M16 family metallopeptidase [Acinetobacter chinensis]|uniref:M16 family metallopeptidase n=1 Tax=Acinetobacter chinensis TaxID=2004650 RepID=UPI002934A464|nr:pitrilysin family protein [Acinetobacter chinensis]WOE40124.1 pitrilysin family protein [Acinetobacter chinensis]
MRFFITALTAVLLSTSISYANVIQEQSSEDSVSDMHSIPLLNSLKNISKNNTYRAPYIHDLKNRYDVRTLFAESQDLPIIDIQLTFNAGAARDTEMQGGQSGVANMAANLLDEGTKRYNAEEIVTVFEQTGASFSAKAYRDMFIVKLRVLADPQKMETALAMMIELLNNATFKKSSIELVLSNTQVGQKQLKENPSRLMGIQFQRAIYGKHPYAEPVTGTNGSIKNITPELLQKFRDRYLVSQNMNIAITGKLTPRQALKLSEKITRNLKQGEKAAPLPSTQLQTGFNIQHIRYTSNQAHVMMGHLGTVYSDPDRLALSIANQMFGGSGFNSVLMKELRIKRGYTYGAYSSFGFSQAPGTFSLSYSTRQDQLINSIQVAHKALLDFVNHPIDKKQLRETKAGMLRAFPNTYRSNASINAQLGSIGFYQLPASYLSQYQQLLEKISADDVQKAVRKYIHPQDMTLVIVSEELDKENLKLMLQRNSDPSYKPDTISPAKKTEATDPQVPLQEAVLPDEVQSDAPASV